MKRPPSPVQFLTFWGIALGVALIVDRAFPSTEWGNWVGLAVAFGVVIYWMRREDKGKGKGKI